MIKGARREDNQVYDPDMNTRFPHQTAVCSLCEDTMVHGPDHFLSSSGRTSEMSLWSALDDENPECRLSSGPITYSHEGMPPGLGKVNEDEHTWMYHDRNDTA
jgi:hypothetical protein